MDIVTEIVNLKTLDSISDEQFIEIVNELEIKFHSRQEGFINTELLKKEQVNSWIIIQHWKTITNANLASKKMFKESITEKFRNALDPQTVKINLFSQMKTWGF